ncbi:DUF2007 domain-containing protein [Sungkyunkwania multivorans]|uniref:DUF2007 domain-containing protein n=1 Tax=Sungkyunkwania multivorans TaxID=1173618 RepID=A0ABW3D016_9FLAO
MKNFVVIATYTYPFEYAVLKTLLASEDIRFIFENETMVQVSPFYSNALGGIHLKVHPNDVAAAMAIIDRLNTDFFPLQIV